MGMPVSAETGITASMARYGGMNSVLVYQRISSGVARVAARASAMDTAKMRVVAVPYMRESGASLRTR